MARRRFKRLRAIPKGTHLSFALPSKFPELPEPEVGNAYMVAINNSTAIVRRSRSHAHEEDRDVTKVRCA